MGGLGVIVECYLSSQGKEVTKEKLSCSGLHLGSGWILSHGTIAVDLLKEATSEPLVTELKEQGFAVNEGESPLQLALHNTHYEFQAIFDEANHLKLQKLELLQKEKIPSVESKAVGLQDLSYPARLQDRTLQLPLVSSPETPSYYCRHAAISMIFIHSGIMKTLAALMPASDGWKLVEDKEGKGNTMDLESIILSSFVLLKINNENNDSVHSDLSSEELHSVVEKLIMHTTSVNKGCSVYIESSPFGSLSPGVFLNSLSKGIISNVCGTEGDICLTDARCIMGSEGAPVYTLLDDRVNFCGIVISPFCWKRGEWLGLSILAAASPVLQSLCQYLKFSIITMPKRPTSSNMGEFSAVQPLKDNLRPVSMEDIARTLDSAVVGIACAGGWGSGIIINTSPGIILTCAHVIQPVKLGKVIVITADGMRIPGQVIYHTFPACFEQETGDNVRKPGSSMWDVAVVQTSVSLPKALPLATMLPPKGSPVFVAGHGIFSPKCLPAPMVSCGILSKVVHVASESLRYPVGAGDNSVLLKYKKQENSSSYPVEPVNLKNVDPKPEVEQNASELAKLQGDGNSGLVPVLFQTTCMVYAGNSGGPVVVYHPQYGLQVAGIMVCNTKDLTNKSTFPHVNLALPASAIHKIISAYIVSKDKTILNYLGVECPAVSRLWALDITPQSHL